jgi:hypothetical protein
MEIDVVRVNPSCKSYANGGHVHARGAAWVVGYSAGEKEAQKTKKHGPRLEEKGITFVPFGVETYGALAKGASKTITNLAECIWNREPEAHSLSNTKRNIQAGVSVSIQRRNASALRLYAKMSQPGMRGASLPAAVQRAAGGATKPAERTFYEHIKITRKDLNKWRNAVLDGHIHRNLHSHAPHVDMTPDPTPSTPLPSTPDSQDTCAPNQSESRILGDSVEPTSVGTELGFGMDTESSFPPEPQDTSAPNPSQSRIHEAEEELSEDADHETDRLSICFLCEQDEMECQCQQAHPAIDLFDPFSFDKHFDELFPPSTKQRQIYNQAALEILNSSSPNS